MEKKRLTAIKTRINSIITGRYVPQEGLNPDYIITSSGLRLSRVRVLATVVDKHLAESGRFASITLDDGSATIRSKAFSAVSSGMGLGVFNGVSIGDIVDVIGKVREYGGEIYLLTEVVHKIDDPNFELLRELELRKQEQEQQDKKERVLEYQKQVSDLEELKRVLKEKEGMSKDEVEAILESQEVEVPEEEGLEKEAKNKILSLIEKLDQGDGCDYSLLIEESGMHEDVIDSIINELLTDGICFEPRPGKIKKL